MTFKILKFSSKSCQPCKELSQTLSHMGVEVEEIDVEQAPTLTKAHGVRAVPTMIAILDGAEQTTRLIGAKTPAQIQNWINEVSK